MAIVIRAGIRKEDFEAFRSFRIPDFPNTYDEWEKFAADDALQFTRIGHEVIEKEINPQKFIAWATSPGGDRSLHGLHTFASRQRDLERD
jgi:hypothetical protein